MAEVNNQPLQSRAEQALQDLSGYSFGEPERQRCQDLLKELDRELNLDSPAGPQKAIGRMVTDITIKVAARGSTLLSEADSAELGRAVEAVELLEELARKPKQEEFVLVFSGSPCGGPGGGGSDSDFYQEVPFKGTRAEAQEELERISWETYHGDFHKWLADKSGKPV